MIIFQLVTSRQYRGAEVFAALLSEQLQQLGHEVHFVGLYTPPKKMLQATGCTNCDLGGTKRAGFSPLLFQRLLRYSRRCRPNIIQANGSDTLKYSVALKMLYPEVKIVYRNISLFSAWVSSEFRRRIQVLMFRKVDYVTSVSEESRLDLIRTLDYPENRIRVVRRGVKQDWVLSQADARLQLSVKGKIVALVGKLSKEKNHSFLLEVFNRLKETLPDAKLWFIGDGPERDNLQRLIIKHGLQDSTKLWGVQANVTPFLAAADVLAITSTVEGIPGVILEGGVQGTPTVSVDVGGVKEVLLHDTTGLLVAGHDTEEFAAALQRILTNPALRNRLGQAARAEVRTHYTLDRAASESMEIYRQIIGSGSF